VGILLIENFDIFQKRLTSEGFKFWKYFCFAWHSWAVIQFRAHLYWFLNVGLLDLLASEKGHFFFALTGPKICSAMGDYTSWVGEPSWVWIVPWWRGLAVDCKK